MPSKFNINDIITNINELSQLLILDKDKIQLPSTIKNFPLQAPYDFIGKIVPKNINDPLLLQILPQKDEEKIFNNYSFDPLQEKKYSPIQGIVHKYPNRILLITTNNCFINCRFCFRRFCKDYIQDWSRVLNYISEHTTTTEVILSGGDPLSLSDNKIQKIISQLADIPHLKSLRIHTRAPIVYPMRIVPKLLDALTSSRFTPVVVVHCNHPNEIDNKVTNAIKLLKSVGIPLYNQSVLLKGINDNAKILANLSEKLFALGIQPYYLHLLDKVMGTQHFDVDINTAKKLLQQMMLILPGYLVPKLVYDDPNMATKVMIAP